MTKNELTNVIVSLKTDLKWLKKNLQFRMDGNDIEEVLSRYQDDDSKYAAQSGAFQAMASMDNDTFKRSIESIEKMEKQLEI
tara:strand:- start:671 stop:916 length:246 start_codon:yes stop_codon:yes gene_type:complete